MATRSGGGGGTASTVTAGGVCDAQVESAGICVAAAVLTPTIATAPTTLATTRRRPRMRGDGAGVTGSDMIQVSRIFRDGW